jgi:hypothetical protein
MKKIYFLLILSFILSGCEEFLTKTPLTSYSEGSVWKSEADIRFALNGLYMQIRGFGNSNATNNSEFVYTFFTDDAWNRRSNRNPNLDLNPSTEIINQDWGNRYKAIRDCNELISRAPDADMDESLKARMITEARCIRAILYDRLNFLFGAVPLIEEPTLPTFYPKRATRIKVFDFVTKEFTEVANTLPEEYTGNDVGRLTKGAALAYKARHLLNAIGWHSNTAELYSGAKEACKSIYESGQYSLEPGIEGFARMFSTETDNDARPSNETIFITTYDANFRYHGYANYIAPKGAYAGTKKNNSSYLGATAAMIEAFQMSTTGKFVMDSESGYNSTNPWENRDPRLEITILHAGEIIPKKGGDGVTPTYTLDPHPKIKPPGGVTTDDVTKAVNPTGYYYSKYLDWNYVSGGEGHIDYKQIRFPEVILMYAEAVLGADNNISLTISLIDEVRTRVGMPDVATSYGNVADAQTALEVILHERRVEFALEGPQRFFDIRRHSLGETVFADANVYGIPLGEGRVANKNVIEGDLDKSKRIIVGTRVFNPNSYYLWPVPQNAIDANQNLLESPE